MQKPWPELPRANVLGVGVHAIDLRRAVEVLQAALQEGHRGYVCVTGVHGIMEAQRSPEFRRVLARSLLVTPDGMPTVWVGRWQGHQQMERVFGPELMSEVCRSSVSEGHTHFLYGGKPGVVEDLYTNLVQSFPGIRVVGHYTPPFRPLSTEEEEQLTRTVSVAKPDIMWVGLSTPTQEFFMANYLGRLDCRLMIGVGAAFDFHTGRIKDSPAWIKRAGLQWLHRLGQEPERLWRRYLLNNSRFLVKIAGQLSGLRAYELVEKK